MAREIRLPQLGETMDTGTVVNCLVKVGDKVKKGDVIFEIETDKATLEMESPQDGFVKHILAEPDETLPVGAPLMVLGDKDEEVSQSFLDSLKSDAPAISSAGAAAHPAAESVKAQPQISKPVSRVMASPRAKKLAEELGVDLTNLTGTGPGGKITEEDIKKAAAPKPARPIAPAAVTAEIKLGETIPLTKKQKLTAERMLKSKREIPCFYLTVKADVTDLVDLRIKLNETASLSAVAQAKADVKISYNDFIIRAVAIGLQKFPIMTGQLAGNTIKLPCTINIGLAVSTPGGLIVPVIKDAHKKDVKQIAADAKALIEKAQNEKLLLTDLEGACITVSNLGAFGIESFIPIVIPGQCSILGIGRITDTCVPNNGNIVIRKLMSLTISVDHKVANGAYAAQFLDFVRKLLEDASTFA
ncbi:MAG: 2-oxo acid dehydrogenase subunit E2 [Sedimentisphaerales bacterium]|nr:2-oxo acid dehydrogenase subunit E2 [Sedimentisphaerales bacterium]